MSNFVSYYISPEKLEIKNQSIWECRNLGLNKIVSTVYKNLIENNLIKNSFILQINCADIPLPQQHRHPNIIFFDCATHDINDQNVFPDYVFGNWWHIGLKDFDTFTNEIMDHDIPITDERLFWIGNLHNAHQRHKFIELCKIYPDKFHGDSMYWTNSGTQPTKFLSIKDHKKYKYLLDINGCAYANNQFGCSGRLKLLPFCDRPLFINDRDCYAWSDIMILNQHLHIQVNNNLDNIIEKYEYAQNNASLLKENANKLLEYCRNNFTFYKVCDYATSLISNKVKYQ